MNDCTHRLEVSITYSCRFLRIIDKLRAIQSRSQSVLALSSQIHAWELHLPSHHRLSLTCGFGITCVPSQVWFMSPQALPPLGRAAWHSCMQHLMHFLVSSLHLQFPFHVLRCSAACRYLPPPSRAHIVSKSTFLWNRQSGVRWAQVLSQSGQPPAT